MSERRHYMFIGGSLDGTSIFMGGDTYAGMEWTGGTNDSGKVEKYGLDVDGKFRFRGWTLGTNPALHSREFLDEMKPLMERLSEVFKDLNALFERYGGHDGTQYGIGVWRFMHKDALLEPEELRRLSDPGE